jgi:peptidoglycan/xylan/chitin deacetylase (PgdA/CDA1 family)
LKASKIIELCYRLGLFDAVHALWPNRLTVLAYHRVIDPHTHNFDTFKPNVSATPAAFAAQLDFIRHKFNVVSINEVVAWLQDQHPLPSNPALITFDDGYRDNLDYALPVLQARGLPAVIFLATDYMGSASPFFWDLIAYCFHHTSKDEVDLPLAGQQQWRDPSSRMVVMSHWLDSLKELPDAEKWAAVEKLPQALDVSVPADAFARMHLTWDQVRQMVVAGVDMGAHTRSHPILTRITPEQARDEVAGSKARIETEINQPVTAFAYPNGQPSDYNPALQTMLQQVGIKAAFTLVPGPTRPAEARQAPMAIRRVFIGYKDTLARFAAKVMGAPRLIGRLG